VDKLVTFTLSITRNGRTYTFAAPTGSPLGESHDVLYEFLEEVVKMAREAFQKLEEQKQKSADASSQTLQS